MMPAGSVASQTFVTSPSDPRPPHPHHPPNISHHHHHPNNSGGGVPRYGFQPGVYATPPFVNNTTNIPAPYGGGGGGALTPSNDAALAAGVGPSMAAPPPYSLSYPAPGSSAFGVYAEPPPSYDDAMKLPKPEEEEEHRERF